MSVDYAGGLSHCDDLGDCGLNELYDSIDDVKLKVDQLANWIRLYRNSCVVHVGAGLSTSAGIRDFRGKNGVWTEYLKKMQSPSNGYSQIKSDEKEVNSFKKIKLDIDEAPNCDKMSSNTTIEMKPFDETRPTLSHMALKQLCRSNYVTQIISQNVDGLFLKAGLERKYICELHGDFYLDECTCCKARFIRCTASKTMRLQKSTTRCPRRKILADTEKQCKGFLRDTILDWESSIPFMELRLATKFSKICKLHICIGTSLQLSPSKDLVCNPKSNKSKKLVIINLQPTKFDNKADMVINYYADYVMKELMSALNLSIPEYQLCEDPTKDLNMIQTQWQR